MTDPTTPRSRAAALRTLTTTLVTAPVFILVAVVFVTGGLSAPLPPWWLCAGLLLLVGAAIGLARLMEAQIAPVPLGADRDTALAHAFAAFQANLFVSLAILEAPLLIGVVVSFVVDHGGWPAVIAGVPSIVALVAVLWPSHGKILRAEARLDRAGGRSYFSEAW